MGTLKEGMKSPMSWGGDTIGRTEVSCELGWEHCRED